MKPLEVYVVDSLVPQLDVYLGFETFGVNGRFYLVRVEDEHATISTSLGYESAIFLDEATFVVQLLAELKLARGCVRDENLLEIFPCLFGRFSVSYVAKHVVVYTCCQAI